MTLISSWSAFKVFKVWLNRAAMLFSTALNSVSLNNTTTYGRTTFVVDDQNTLMTKIYSIFSWFFFLDPLEWQAATETRHRVHFLYPPGGIVFQNLVPQHQPTDPMGIAVWENLSRRCRKRFPLERLLKVLLYVFFFPTTHFQPSMFGKWLYWLLVPWFLLWRKNWGLLLLYWGWLIVH